MRPNYRKRLSTREPGTTCTVLAAASLKTKPPSASAATPRGTDPSSGRHAPAGRPSASRRRRRPFSGAEADPPARRRAAAQRSGPAPRTPRPRRPAVSLEEEEAAVLRVGGENAAVSKDGQVGLRQDIPAPPADGELRGVPLPEALDAAVPGVGHVEAPAAVVGDADGLGELAAAAAVPAEDVEGLAIERVVDQALVPSVGHPERRVRGDADIARSEELQGAGGRTGARLVPAGHPLQLRRE